jgi:hypothetical protein
VSIQQEMVDDAAEDAAKSERDRILAFGKEYLARKVESAFSTAHLSNFLDAVERGEHWPMPTRLEACGEGDERQAGTEVPGLPR